MTGNGSSLLLLAIDYSRESPDLISTGLAQNGLRILTASDAATGLAIFSQQHSQPREEIQKRHLVLEAVDGNKSRAAEILGIGRSTLYQLLFKMEEAGALERSPVE